MRVDDVAGNIYLVLLCGGGSRTNGVVSEIRPGEVTVDWLAGSGHGGDAPPGTLNAALCFPLTYYAHTCWQLGDRAVVDDEVPDEYYQVRRCRMTL
jgi:hypothetical protein